MNQLITNYQFNVSAKTITLTDLAEVKLERIRYIKNLSTNTFIYLLTNNNTITTIAGNVITFTGSTTGMNDTDKLAIQYDDGIQVSSESSNSSISTAIGSRSDASATSDSGTFSIVALLKRLLGKLPTLVSGRLPVDVQSLTVSVDNASIEISNDVGNPIPMSAASLPLPTGAATSVNQNTANTSELLHI
ncbi:MAG TPA: hypothetical protein PLP33_29415 [Leptospiraceae bacterium]|nr:hypothetical protein [Leptospiraceae bacterium]HMZ66536.1 hypothetical protein [Leptospiraceae bacterium]HNA10434.1 hypothetical protein [Leptospiraceae bacterium]HNB98540.1 hypothetical protein [Leptospiraceae bacterium]HNC59583.1 hypothetical protein [Leptospiraceae bacterium]